MSFAKFERFILDKITETKLPSVSAAIFEGDQIIWSRGFGFRNLENGLAATPRTLYGIASVTKSFTSLAIMQLAEQGKLKIDDPIDQYMPFDIRPGGEKVRIWHLMTHSSGIPALAYAENFISGMTGAEAKWLMVSGYEDILTFMQDAGDWTLAKPGERWFYLNEGYVLLGHIVEQCSGQPYEEYIQSHILQPLGMTRTFFSKQDVENDSDAATPYINWAKEGLPIPSTYAYGITADGGLVSNTYDLAQYVAMYLGWGKHNGVQLLSSDSIKEMETPRVATPADEGPFGDEGYGYGLGTKSNFLGHKLVGHSGSIGTATSYIGYIRDKNVGIALVANGSGYSTSQMGMYGLALAIGADPDELAYVRGARLLDELEGMYETYKGTSRYLVRRADDLLFVEYHDKYDSTSTVLIPELLEEKTRRFYSLSSGVKTEMEFRVEDGKIELIYERYLLRKIGKLAR